MSNPSTEQREVTFAAPGPGAWELDATHRGRRPMSMYVREGLMAAMGPAVAVLLERYGLPLARMEMKFVEGCLYMRPVAVGEGAKPSKPPPAPIMKLIARLHPEMRRRNRTAREAWEEKRWREEVDRWFNVERPQIVAANLEFQAAPLAALDDRALIEHLHEVTEHFFRQAALNMENHGGDLMPAGDYLAHCKQWGIEFGDAAALFAGSSPATLETAELLAPAAHAINAADHVPESIEEVRALSPDASASVEAWRDLHGWRLVTTDDIDKPTLAERPGLQLSALLSAVRPGSFEQPSSGVVRDRVPADQRLLFDELLDEARYGMRQRDDVVGVRWNWSGGLLRRALLEVGRRLQATGKLDHTDHVVDLTPDEAASLLINGTGPSPSEVADRAARRDLVERAGAPDMLGEEEAPPPFDALPAPMARAAIAMMTAFEAEGLTGDGGSDQLCGIGVGDKVYRGPARVADHADDALDRLERGDVLVAPFTGPAYNSVIPILGGLVVESGGSMCHAAIVAREFGLPAVIGAAGATTQITDGAMVEIDPTAGVVRVIADTDAVKPRPPD
jgi:phosphohistidine swiveling domain-containing protein